MDDSSFPSEPVYDLLRVVAADLDDYRQFQVEHLPRIRGVQSVKTEIPMQKIKLTSEIPV
ncbi:Lrp/AsnC ligand binding domain-containing protein [Crenobacter sp. SG2303]|uniref:Lrp/AsnC ligand binding domain-containing protein n=1 Tax=Crenobacter oryzisoli TaxID=3056844 RepID=A0ABT7XT28_9NEIS|nr:Lrp/AsnC ligand binding domain-containing protein [Crenobacter sp. SG2303]MDN0076942.1 Lrp/AsnC ligand binding domain-containing protein [Crenobacter sp. SG2303]